MRRRKVQFNPPSLASRLFCFCLALSGSILVAANPVNIFPEQVQGRLFTVQGSNTVGANLMKMLLQDYFEARGASGIQVRSLPTPNEYQVQGNVGQQVFHVAVAAHGSSTGFRALMSGDANLAMSSRRIKRSEQEKLRRLGDLQSFDSEHVIAIDGLAVIVSKSNPIGTLTMEQLALVFSGELTDWSQLGGEPGAINIYARDENSGTWDTFRSLVLGDTSLSPRARRFESNDELSDLVAADRQGIGFVGLASVRQSKSLAISDSGTQALAPERVVVATEDYPLARRLYLYSPQHSRDPLLLDFLDYVQSDRGQRIVDESGFVSQNLISVKDSVSDSAPPAYRALVETSERLSVNLRFAEDSAELDNKAKRDIQRIVDYMQRSENAAKRLYLVGFGDQRQSERRAVVLSQLRATAIKSELFRRGIGSEQVLGLGADLPVAGNGSSGRNRNRRVEVWVKGDSLNPGREQ